MKVREVVEGMPDASAMEGLQAVAEQDPVVWGMLYRRVKGQALIYDNAKKLSEESLGTIKKTLIKSDYEDELYDRLLHHRPYLTQPARDQHKHQSYQKARQVGVSELGVTKVMHFLATHPGTKWVTCVPDDAEVLTRRGWKFYTELLPDDQTLALDWENGVSRWEPILEVKTFAWRGFLSAVGMAPFHCTTNHRWPVRERIKSTKTSRRKIVEAQHLNQQHTLVRMAPHQYDGAPSVLSDRHAALLGWVVTDGHQWMTGTKPHLNTVMMEISQNERKHLKEIEFLAGKKADPATKHTDAPTIAIGDHGGRIVGIRDPKAKLKKDRYLYGGQHRVRLAREDVDAILASGYRTKSDLPALVSRLSPSAAYAMWDAMLKAEGNKSGRQLRSTHFTQNHGPVLDAFQILCALTDCAANLNARGAYVISSTSRSARMRAAYKDDRDRDRYYMGQVWCPRTPSGTWMMRYRGHVVFTGNTFPRDRQLIDFSNTRVANTFAESPYMNDLVGTPNQVMAKAVGKSHWLFRSAWESNLGEGIDADGVTLDEMDRMRDKIEFAFKESLKSSKHHYMVKISTPTLPNSGINVSFSNSDQMTWLVKCSKCGLEQEITHTENIVAVKHIQLGTKELPPESYDYLCRKQKCRGKLDRVFTGRWVPKYPDRRLIRGYHMSQLIACWISATQVMQDKIDMRFIEIWMNYVLGLPASGALEMISDQDCQMACAGHQLFEQRTGDYTHVTAGIDWGNCHDSETRVLTERGFVFFKDLSPTDKVAQWDVDTREMSFCKPCSVTKKDYDGEMIHFTGKGVDVMVTPKHRMRVGNRWTGEWVTEPASALAERSHATFVGGVSWEGAEVNRFTLPGLPSSPGYPGCDPHIISMDTWLEFLGYYLSEGGLCFARKPGHEPRPSCVKMSQRDSVNPDNVVRMRACLEAVDIRFSEFPNTDTTDVNWTIYGKQLWSWVQENVGSSCSTKRIPREFFNLSRRQLRILLDAMMLGDGSKTEHGGVYHSTSRGLCEDFLEICVRLGYRASTRRIAEAEGNRKAKFVTSWTARGADRYWCKVSEHVERVPYSGKVYCCTVPSGYIITERNGHVAYHGNCNWVTVFGRNGINNRTYVIGLAVFEDVPGVPLGSAIAVGNYLEHFGPDLIIADAGYGKDRNSYIKKRFSPNDEGRFYAQYYNPSEKTSRTFQPEWSDPARARVLVDRTLHLKNLCHAVKAREFGLPDVTLEIVQLLIKHLKSLAPYNEVDDHTKQVVESVRSSGEDHFAHASASGLLAMERLAKLSRFSASFV